MSGFVNIFSHSRISSSFRILKRGRARSGVVAPDTNVATQHSHAWGQMDHSTATHLMRIGMYVSQQHIVWSVDFGFKQSVSQFYSLNGRIKQSVSQLGGGLTCIYILRVWGSLTLELSLSCGRLTCEYITTVGSDTETSLYVHAVSFSTGWVMQGLGAGLE